MEDRDEEEEEDRKERERQEEERGGNFPVSHTSPESIRQY